MKPFIITTDSNSDVDKVYREENNIKVISHYYNLNDVIYDEESQLPFNEFYDHMRNGDLPTTMASNPQVIYDTFTKLVNEGYDVLHISFSSELSSGYSNVYSGAANVMEENEGSKIVVVDSLNASLGQGLLIYYATEMKKSGKSIDEIVEWIEENKNYVNVYFTVDDLNHLYRGGRISKAAAVLGTMIELKPIIYINNQGKLLQKGKVRGRKKSLGVLVENMDRLSQGIDRRNEVVCIVHGDDEESAKQLEKMVRDKFNIKNIITHSITPSIGAHSGPGAIGLVFWGREKEA